MGGGVNKTYGGRRTNNKCGGDINSRRGCIISLSPFHYKGEATDKNVGRGGRGGRLGEKVLDVEVGEAELVNRSSFS